MSGGGVLKPWQYAHQVVFRLTQADSIVVFDRQLEDVMEVWLTEYMVHNNGTPAANNLWRIDLSRDGWCFAEQTSNAAGQGHCIAIGDMTNLYHHSYDTPRVMSQCPKKGVSSMRVRIVDEFGNLCAFHNVTLFVTFVMRRGEWSAEDARLAQDRWIEWWRSNQNSSRFIVDGQFV